MKFDLEIKVFPIDFWIISMKKTYSTPIGVCNIIFTLASIGLTARFYSEANNWVQLLLLLTCLIFPVFQPIMVYLKAKTQTSMIPVGMRAVIDDAGVYITVGEQSEKISWNRVTQVITNSQMVILRVDKKNGYFFTNRVLGTKKDDFINYVESKIKK